MSWEHSHLHGLDHGLETALGLDAELGDGTRSHRRRQALVGFGPQ